jgi:hypothetical protein
VKLASHNFCGRGASACSCLAMQPMQECSRELLRNRSVLTIYLYVMETGEFLATNSG